MDVPKGIDSDTDAETEMAHHMMAPALPPKDLKPLHASGLSGTTTDSDMTAGGMPEDAVDGSPVERISHSTFIAPALPPIRFSMNNADFTELFNSVNGHPFAESLDSKSKQKKVSQGNVSSISPPTAASASMPKPPSSGRLSSPSTGKEEQVNPTMTLTSVQDDASDSTIITHQSTETNKSQNVQQSDLDTVLLRLRESINSAKEKGGRQVQVDIDFADTAIELLESRNTAFCQLKTKLDGMNVSALFCLTKYSKHPHFIYSARVNVTSLV